MQRAAEPVVCPSFLVCKGWGWKGTLSVIASVVGSLHALKALQGGQVIEAVKQRGANGAGAPAAAPAVQVHVLPRSQSRLQISQQVLEPVPNCGLESLCSRHARLQLASIHKLLRARSIYMHSASLQNI